MKPGQIVLLDRSLKVVLIKILDDTEQAVIELAGSTTIVPLASLTLTE